VVATDWSDLELVGAFAVGAILATIALLRMLRAVVSVFDKPMRRRWRHDDPDES